MNQASLDRALGRIEGHLEGIVDDITELKTGQARQQVEISRLQGWRWRASGFASGIALVVSLLVSLVTSGFHIGR